MRDLLAKTIIAVPIINEFTDQGIITALKLEQSVLFGLTFGAWFKVGMIVALGLLIIERTVSIYLNIKNRDKPK
tara:strand:+ start:2918 stop:3139 length:222 start_codon:yes stop_codon:yes gene_type:complete